MYFKTLILAATIAATPLTFAENDPYLWLEGVDDEKALDWVRAENASSAERLKSGPLFEDLYAQARTILNSSSRIPSVYQEEGWLYNFWRDEKNPRGIFRRTTLAEFAKDEPEWEVVFDIDKLSKKDNKQWVFKGMSCLPKHPEHCLVRLSPGGGDAVVTREFNSVDKTFIEDGFSLPVSKGSVGWIDANTIFVSTNFGEGSMTESGYPRIVKRWKRGTPLAAAELLYESDITSVSASAFRLHSAGGDIDLVRDGKTFWTSERYQLIDGDKQYLELPVSATVNGAFQGRLIVSLKEDWTRGDTTYLQGTVLIADTTALHAGGKGVVDVLIEPDDTTVVQSVTTTDETILVTVLENVRGKIYRYSPGTEGRWDRKAVDFPDNGSLVITSTDDATGNFFARYESFTSPPALYYVASHRVLMAASIKPSSISPPRQMAPRCPIS